MQLRKILLEYQTPYEKQKEIEEKEIASRPPLEEKEHTYEVGKPVRRSIVNQPQSKPSDHLRRANENWGKVNDKISEYGSKAYNKTSEYVNRGINYAKEKPWNVTGGAAAAAAIGLGAYALKKRLKKKKNKN